MATTSVARIGTPHGLHAAGIFAETSIDGEEIGTLVLVVDRAKNLPNRKTMGKQNPYCAARLGKYAKKTPTDKRGGQTPRWDKELRFNVYDSIDYRNLKISIFNDDKRTDLIGETWVDLNDVILPGGGQADGWHNLNCKGRYAGELRLELTFYDSRAKPEKAVSAETDKGKEKEKSHVTVSQAIQPPETKQAVPGPREQPTVKRRPLPANPTAQLTTSGSTADRGHSIPTREITARSYNNPPRHATVTDPGPEDFDPSEFPQQNPSVSSMGNYETPNAEQEQRTPSQRAYGYDERDRPDVISRKLPEHEVGEQSFQNPRSERSDPMRPEVPRKSSHAELTSRESLSTISRQPDRIGSKALYSREVQQEPSRHEMHDQLYAESEPPRPEVQTQQYLLHDSSRPEVHNNQLLQRNNASPYPPHEHYTDHQGSTTFNSSKLPPLPPAHTPYEDHDPSYNYDIYEEEELPSQYEEQEAQESFHHDSQIYEHPYVPEDGYESYETQYIPAAAPHNNRVRFAPEAVPSGPALQSHFPNSSASAAYTRNRQTQIRESNYELEGPQNEMMEVPNGTYDDPQFHNDQLPVWDNFTGPALRPTHTERSYGPSSQLTAPIRQHSDPTLPPVNQRSFHTANAHQSNVRSRPFHVASNSQPGPHSGPLQGYSRPQAQHRQSLPVRAAQNVALTRPQPGDYQRPTNSHRPRPSEPVAQVLHPWDDGYDAVGQSFTGQSDPTPVQRRNLGSIPGNSGHHTAAPTSRDSTRFGPPAFQEDQPKINNFPMQNHGVHPDGRALIKPRPVSPRRDAETGRPLGNNKVILRKSLSPRPSDAFEQSAGTAYSPESFSAYNPEPSRPMGLSQANHDDRKPVPMYQNFGNEAHSAPISPVDIINEEGYIVGSDGRSKHPSDHLPLSTYAPEPERKGNRPTTVVTVKSRLGPRDSNYTSGPIQPLATNSNTTAPTTMGNEPGPRKLQKPNSAPPSTDPRSRFQPRLGNVGVSNRSPGTNMNNGSPLTPAQPSVINSNNYSSGYPPALPPIPTKYLQRGSGYGEPVEDYDNGNYNQAPYSDANLLHQNMANMDISPVTARNRLRRARY